MSELNYTESVVIPDNPKVVPNEVFHVYVPKASYNTPGVAKFSSDSFIIEPDGTVRIINSAVSKGIIDYGISTDSIKQLGCESGQMAFELAYEKGNTITGNGYQIICHNDELVDKFDQDVRSLIEFWYKGGVDGKGVYCSVRLSSHHYNFSRINEIYASPSADGKYHSAWIYVDEMVKETVTNTPYLWILSAPELGTYDIGRFSWAIGCENESRGYASYVEGRGNNAYGWYSHIEGLNNTGYYLAHVEGKNNFGAGVTTHTEGENNIAYGKLTHAEGYYARAIADHSHVEGYGADLKQTISNDSGLNGIPVIPDLRTAMFENEYAIVQECWDPAKYGDGAIEDAKTGAYAYNSHVEGYGCYTRRGAVGAHVEGHRNCVLNLYGHAEGYYTVSYGKYAHSEGSYGIAYGDSSHSEGWTCVAYGNQSHAEGWQTYAKGLAAHAEGARTQALAKCSHAAGKGTKTGYREGDESYCEGQYVIGLWNAVTDAAFIIGKGTSDNDRRNVFEVYKNGDIVIDGIRLTRSQLLRLSTM